MSEILNITEEKWLAFVEVAPEKDLFLRMGKKGFMVIPPEFWVDSMKETVKALNIFGEGSQYIFLRSEGGMSVFSYGGILDELERD